MIKKETITLKLAKRKLEHADDEIWDILERVTKHHPVMLNRAPTLHRLGIQAFEPVLIEGLAIQLHPLTCAAFNADFDGDQMAVHVPVSQEAQVEAKTLMMATNNILSPASGKPITAPSHDMILGINYVTKIKVGEKGEGSIFTDKEDAISAHQHGKIALHAKIKVRGTNKIGAGSEDKNVKAKDWTDYTTVGRIIFNEAVPEQVSYINKVITKKDVSNLVDDCFKDPKIGHHKTVVLLDNLMKLGFTYATKSGLSISLNDMIIPSGKPEIIKIAQKIPEYVWGSALVIFFGYILLSAIKKRKINEE